MTSPTPTVKNTVKSFFNRFGEAYKMWYKQSELKLEQREIQKREHYKYGITQEYCNFYGEVFLPVFYDWVCSFAEYLQVHTPRMAHEIVPVGFDPVIFNPVENCAYFRFVLFTDIDGLAAYRRVINSSFPAYCLATGIGYEDVRVHRNARNMQQLGHAVPIEFKVRL